MNARRWLAHLALLGLAAPAAAAPLRVVVSILPQRAFVEAVAGPHARVEVLVGPGRNMHTYEPTPKQMAALAEADLVLPIGVPFEHAWLPRLAAANPKLRVVDLLEAAGVERLPMIGRAHAGHETHGEGELDPHVWTDPGLVARLLPPLAAALAEADPAHAADYTAGAERYAGELAALDGELRSLFAGLAGRRFLVFHPSWGYLAAAYGLVQVAIEHEGKEPGARALAGLI
ncbi:ABC transporter substrate-binding protein, partial [bacterium]|nr:ABC transporter substrate-binding protein [bacterium]